MQMKTAEAHKAYHPSEQMCEIGTFSRDLLNSEQRSKLTDRLQSYLECDTRELELIPRVNLKPVAPEEVKFHTPPDICVLGPEFLSEELTELAS